ncbi:MAG: lysozyme inhibitor LprI family protein [Planctomycetota bacterium]
MTLVFSRQTMIGVIMAIAAVACLACCNASSHTKDGTPIPQTLNSVTNGPPNSESSVRATTGPATQTTIDTIQSQHRTLRELRTEIDAELSRLRQTWDPERISLLDADQSAWELFTDARVRLAADAYRGGTLSSIFAGNTRIKLAQERLANIRQLGEMLDGK